MYLPDEEPIIKKPFRFYRTFLYPYAAVLLYSCLKPLTCSESGAFLSFNSWQSLLTIMGMFGLLPYSFLVALFLAATRTKPEADTNGAKAIILILFWLVFVWFVMMDLSGASVRCFG